MSASNSQCVACSVCGEFGCVKLLFELRKTCSSTLSRETFGLVECPCGDLIHLSPSPTPRDLKALYEESRQFSSPEYVDPKRVALADRYYSIVLANLLTYLGWEQGATKRLLEIGAGRAWMSRVAKKLPGVWVTVAQDVSDECRESSP